MHFIYKYNLKKNCLEVNSWSIFINFVSTKAKEKVCSFLW